MKTHTQIVSLERPVGVHEGRALRKLAKSARLVLDKSLIIEPVPWGDHGFQAVCDVCQAWIPLESDEFVPHGHIEHVEGCPIDKLHQDIQGLGRACVRDVMTTRPAGLGERCEECHRVFCASELVVETPVGLLCHSRPHRVPGLIEVTR